MIKLNVLILIIFFSMNFLFGQDRIVIMDFKTTGIEKDYGEIANELITTTIVDNNKWTVVERSQINQILNEMKLSASDDFDDSQSLEIGKLAKANFILLGNISKIVSKYSLTGKLINIQTGEIVLSKKVLIESIDDLYDGFEKLGNLICDNSDTHSKTNKNEIYIEKKVSNPKYKFLTNDFVSNKRSTDRNYMKLYDIDGITHLVIIPNNNIIIEKLTIKINRGKNFKNDDSIYLEKDKEYIIQIAKKPSSISSMRVTYRITDNKISNIIIKYFVY